MTRAKSETLEEILFTPHHKLVVLVFKDLVDGAECLTAKFINSRQL